MGYAVAVRSWGRRHDKGPVLMDMPSALGDRSRMGGGSTAASREED